ncbi:CYTH domain-containing protein [Myxococcota bacterium]|nr:CYTH domain-containing protein [Myxococcota bacterium]MBU1433211.1 CYTH domain-containing protein [Myxococcota bacterium]MBU1896329.1 CYTH domain-containing protein [Myxococcota bacterium]
MAKEIERKFLVVGDAWKSVEGTHYRQGYLSTVKERTVRVRTINDQGFLTIKGITQGVSRLEFEYEIPHAEATQLLDALCERPLVEKTRRKIKHGAHIWEVDAFHGVNEGLVVAEIELSHEDEAFDKPAWVAEEVSGDPRYFNSNLIARPYTTW